MASESSAERTMSITLPAELDEWLDEQAATAEVDREQLLLQLLAAYRETAAEENEGLGRVDEETLAETVDSQLDEQLSARLGELQSRLDDRIETRVEATLDEAVTDQITEATNSIQRQLSNRIDQVEEDFDEKIVDVRDRVIQIKKDADAKAPADHTHQELEQVPEVERRLDELESRFGTLEGEFGDRVPDHEESIEELSARVEQMEDRLQTIAWVVSDLRDAHESKGGLETVERIKRAAAKADIERAKCENCGDSVQLSLLTDPECPHCEATVSNVEPAGGWFGKPKLLTAAELEAGDTDD